MSKSVSVVIPAHNASATIAAAIDSAIRQTRRPLEIVIVDDASTDSTRDVVEALGSASDVPIRLYSNSTNSGPGVARNLGWDMARGDLVAFLDADDVWHPQKLEIQVPIMESSPSLAMSAHDRTVGVRPEWATIDPADVRWHGHGFRAFLVRNRCATPSVIVRRNIAERFNSDLRRAEDYYLWLSITRHHGPVRFADATLVHCANPSYGGHGLSGNLTAMFRSEIRAMRFLAANGRLPWLVLPAVIAWLTIKFVVRVVDHRLLRDRLQTVSESK